MKLTELRSLVQPPPTNPYDALFTRHVSILLTAALAPLGITANQVSSVNLLVGLGACLLIAFGDHVGVIVGIVLVHLYAVLDSVDGELARLRREFTLTGLFLEDLSAFHVIVAFPLAVGLHMMRGGAGPLVLILAATYAAFGRTAMAVARRAVLKSIRTKRPVSPETPVGPILNGGAGTLRRLVDDFLLNHTIIRAVVSTSLLIEIAIGRVSPVITAWILGAALVGLLLREAATIVLLLRKDTLDKMLQGVYRDAGVVKTNAADADVFELARS